MFRFVNSLTGRILTLTVIFVMLAEVLIFLPSVARFRVDYLQERLNLSQIASLTLLAAPGDMIDNDVRMELLENAEVLNVVLRRNAMRELVLSKDMPGMVDETYDLRERSFIGLIIDAQETIWRNDDRVIRVIGNPVKDGGQLIEVSLVETPLRQAMIDYAITILILSLLISVITAALLFFALRGFIVKPIKRVVNHMMVYSEDPEDQQRIIRPKSRVTELRQAEHALADMQAQLTQSLRQKDRLAALGGAVSRISHDLRNMLTTAQLLADRFETSADPTVKRTTPKLIGSLGRAIALCERTLTFGKAEEPAPEIRDHRLASLVEDVLESDSLRSGEGEVQMDMAIPEDLMVAADEEHLFRVLTNLVRNARQAILGTGKPGSIRVSAGGGVGGTWIEVADTGPGIAAPAVETLFQPFKGSSRRGGTGLGLAIAAELIRGHGGALEMVETSQAGTVFRISLPARLAEAS